MCSVPECEACWGTSYYIQMMMVSHSHKHTYDGESVHKHLLFCLQVWKNHRKIWLYGMTTVFLKISGIYDKHLSLVDTNHVMGIVHLVKYWAPVHFPQTGCKCNTNQSILEIPENTVVVF